MKQVKYEPKSKDSYTTSDVITEYMRKKLQFLEKEEKLRRAGEELTEREKQERKNLNRKKTYILNKIIFPAMANLTVFLEYIAKNQELQKDFDDDLKDLFFGMHDNNPKGKIPVFMRFILSAVTWNYKKEKGQNNFRLELLRIMQRVIYNQLINIAMYELNPNVSSILIESDLGRAYTWTELLAANVKLKEAIETSKRKVLF